ncbi:MAG: hypothetical protein BJ554DRAFT_339, partial [Olpidium bornovanus]
EIPFWRYAFFVFAVRHCGSPLRFGNAVRRRGSPLRLAVADCRCGSPSRFPVGSPLRFIVGSPVRFTVGSPLRERWPWLPGARQPVGPTRPRSPPWVANDTGVRPRHREGRPATGMADNTAAAPAASLRDGVRDEPEGGGPVAAVPDQAESGSEGENLDDCRDPALAVRAENSVLREFLDLLSSEVAIDLDKLRDAARHGIPGEVRRVSGVAGKIFAAKEISILKAKAEEYAQIEKDNPEIVKRVRGEASRYMQRVDVFKDNAATLTTFERVIGAYFNHNKAADYYPAFVHLCGPFVHVMQTESDAFYCLEQLMSQLGEQPVGRFTLIPSTRQRKMANSRFVVRRKPAV